MAAQTPLKIGAHIAWRTGHAAAQPCDIGWLRGQKSSSSASKKPKYAGLGRSCESKRRLTCADTRKNNRTRACVEHTFGVIKNLWGYRKVRYKGLAKNAGQVFTMFALANFYLVRYELPTT